MLTLQQLLESDSIATIVAKLNTNFQVISSSNGGPQGIRGVQGIPGLPGKLGPTGPTGATGATGTFIGIIPFAARDGGYSFVGPLSPAVAPNGQSVQPWPYSSWVWLMWYYGGGVDTSSWPSGLTSLGITAQGVTASNGDVFIDHANSGYWKYLESPESALGGNPDGADDGLAYPPFDPSGYTAGGYYKPAVSLTYPVFSNPALTSEWVGPGWYFYPEGDSSIPPGTVWIEDYTTYLVGPQPAGPYPEGPFASNATSPLTVPNARLVTKYGTVWITTGNDSITGTISDSDFDTSTIGAWGINTSVPTQDNPGRVNAGTDRLLFKFSLDGIPYLSNITARGFTLAGPNSNVSLASTAFPENANVPNQPMHGINFWVKPLYDTTIDKYTPLLFLSERDPELNGTGTKSNYSSLALFMHTTVDEEGITVNNEGYHKSIFTWSSRAAEDPLTLQNNLLPGPNPKTIVPIDSASTVNYGEFLMDFRRLVTSNQYVCSVPADMKLSSDFISVPGLGPSYYSESDFSNTAKYRAYQGYISAINGKSLTGGLSFIDSWEFGLGGASPGSAGYTGGIHDSSASAAGFQTRKTWYGSAVFDNNPSDWSSLAPGTGDYIRVAGMQERGRRFFTTVPSGGGATPVTGRTFLLSELMFYTSQYEKNITAGPNTGVNAANNDHNSFPSLYISPFRNIGIGTFVGGNNSFNDLGPLEPAAKLHVHVKEPNSRDYDPTYTWKDINASSQQWYDTLPTETFAAAAFSGAYGFASTAYVTDILLGNIQAQSEEYVTPVGNIVNEMIDRTSGATINRLRNAIRTDAWQSVNGPTYINSLRFGAQGLQTPESIGRSTTKAALNEFQLNIHPLTHLGDEANQEDKTKAISGIGLHNLFPQARVHFFGKNAYNESLYGQEPIYAEEFLSPGGTFTNNYPFYRPTAANASKQGHLPSNNQVIIDYIGSSYTYPVGLREYQYYTWGATSSPSSIGQVSPNSVVYPNRDSFVPTRFAVPYTPSNSNNGYRSTAPGASYAGAYRHGPTANGWWEATSYIGFNLFRDISTADGHIAGDDLNETRWILGTGPNSIAQKGNQGYTAGRQGLNGGAAIMFTPEGELGIVMVPNGRDGGMPYTQWEQRGLGTRDVLNQMKIVFDKNGNIAVGNAAGWDLDAYPGMEREIYSGKLKYIPTTNATTLGPVLGAPGSSTYTYSYWTSEILNLVFNPSPGQYGLAYHPLYPETAASSPSALINKRATQAEYIRLEVAAEKAWDREGRTVTKSGWGYPPNATLNLSPAEAAQYLQLPAPVVISGGWSLQTDDEGRIVGNIVSYTGAWPGAPGNPTAPTVVVFPHPKEFEASGTLNGTITPANPTFSAPVGAIAAEWWGMSKEYNPLLGAGIFSSDYSENDLDYLSTFGVSVAPNFASFFTTVDLRGSANVRLNNFVWGEGYGFSGPGGQTGGTTNPLGNCYQDAGEFTRRIVQRKRQESPKIILTFLERTPAAPNLSGYPGDYTYQIREATYSGVLAAENIADPYKKVSTVIASAQNEASVREYWIPKTDNTGGTIMVFTDHWGSKEKSSGFDRQLTGITGAITGNSATGYTLGNSASALNNLQLLQVVTLERLPLYSGSTAGGYTGVTAGFVDGGNLDPGGFDLFRDSGMGYVNYYTDDKGYYSSGSSTSPFFPAGTYGYIVSTNFSTAKPLGVTAQADYPLGAEGVTISGGTTLNHRAAVLRNLDYYYKIHPGSTSNYDGNLNIPGITALPNRATEIRFKRINSEFALIDFNITVQVMNPAIGNDAPGFDSFIDLGSPRMTQALKFVYHPDQQFFNETGNTLHGNYENTYGNNLSFSEWSSYRKWNPGTAVVGDDTIGERISSLYQDNVRWNQVDTPYFISPLGDSTGANTRTWNGNFIDFGYYRQGALVTAGPYGIDTIFNRDGQQPGLHDITPNRDQLIFPGYSLSNLNAGISNRLIYSPLFGTPLTGEDVILRAYFVKNLAAFYSTYGNHTMSRSRSMMWRITPYDTWNVDHSVSEPSLTVNNNAFVIEVMFDTPIMHVETAFDTDNFGPSDGFSQAGVSSNGYCRPYRYLTLSGQSIVRYQPTSTTYGAGGGGGPVL